MGRIDQSCGLFRTFPCTNHELFWIRLDKGLRVSHRVRKLTPPQGLETSEKEKCIEPAGSPNYAGHSLSLNLTLNPFTEYRKQVTSDSTRDPRNQYF